MPWDASGMQKHNHALHGEKAGHAARIANAVLRSSGDEGMALAVANKWAGKHATGGIASYAEGGMLPSEDQRRNHEQANRFRAAETDAQRMERSPPESADWMLDARTRNMTADMRDPWWAPEHRRGGALRRDDGGSVTGDTAIGGVPPSAQSANPLMQGMVQRYQAMPVEKLTELAARLGGTPQGQLVQRLLSQRRMMPDQAPKPQDPNQAAPMQNSSVGTPSYRKGGPVRRVEGGGVPFGDPRWMPRYGKAELMGSGLGRAIDNSGGDQDLEDIANSLRYHGMHVPKILGYRKGGAVKRAIGGMMSQSEAAPWWTRREASGEDSGLLHGATPGRADSIQTTAPAGAYIIPADVIAGLGEGNTLSGARVMQAIIGSGPYGTPMPRGGAGRGPPHPPSVPRSIQSELKQGGTVPVFRAKRRSGGSTPNGHTPVDLSDGEYVVAPEHVTHLGGGDLKRGHAILDKWVVAQRKKQIAKLRKLKPPVKT